jgi:hypothetical protein
MDPINQPLVWTQQPASCSNNKSLSHYELTIIKTIWREKRRQGEEGKNVKWKWKIVYTWYYITRGKIKIAAWCSHVHINLNIQNTHMHHTVASVIFLVIWWLITILLWGLRMAPGFRLALTLASRPWARSIPVNNKSNHWLLPTIQFHNHQGNYYHYNTQYYSMHNMTIHSHCRFIKELFFQIYKFWNQATLQGMDQYSS